MVRNKATFSTGTPYSSLSDSCKMPFLAVVQKSFHNEYLLIIITMGHAVSDLTPSNPGSGKGSLSRGGALSTPHSKSMKELCCYLELRPI